MRKSLWFVVSVVYLATALGGCESSPPASAPDDAFQTREAFHAAIVDRMLRDAAPEQLTRLDYSPPKYDMGTDDYAQARPDDVSQAPTLNVEFEGPDPPILPAGVFAVVYGRPLAIDGEGNRLAGHERDVPPAFTSAQMMVTIVNGFGFVQYRATLNYEDESKRWVRAGELEYVKEHSIPEG